MTKQHLAQKEKNEIYKSDRVSLMTSEGGVMTATMLKCFNAIQVSLQNFVIEHYTSVDTAEDVLGESVLEFEVPWVEFCQTMGWKSTNRDSAKKTVKTLRQVQVEWGLGEYDTGSAGYLHIISGAKIDNGVLSVRIDPLVRRELLNLRGLASIAYDVSLINSAWSDKYTPRFYELCLRNWRDGKNSTRYSVDGIREAVDCPYEIVNGEKVWANAEFRDFNKRVLSKAVKNINESNFIDFNVQVKTVGKPVHTIFVGLSLKESFDNSLNDRVAKQVLNLLIEHGLKQAAENFYDRKLGQTNSLHKLTSKEYHYLQYCIEKYIEKIGSIRPGNESRYLTTCLERNEEAFEPIWAKIQDSLEQERKKQRQEKIVYEQQLNEAKKAKRAEVKGAYNASVVAEYMSELSQVQKDALIEQAAKSQNKTNPSRLFDKLPQAAKDAIVRQYVINSGLVDDMIDQAKLKRLLKNADETIEQEFKANKNRLPLIQQ
ncbi:hypothetical protein DS2_15429 [Catenovulum agarivorans DS-2]|uniref:Uncharacterized protein n=1 Tax=Catenovulum agarivorans DS-2 TaxID=1328313 RepID=W7QL46_9ALTE|nr:replication initiation protein [Catenovulum agarivorans]EWH08863.1 hypothetical protein DS2_15429 [Catenovulum agarivorans DS-2]